MATKNSTLFTLSLLPILFIFFLYLTLPISSTSLDTICQSTPHPSICKSMLRLTESEVTIRDSVQVSLKQSLLSAKKILSLVKKYLKSQSKSSEIHIGALEDCQFLLGLSIDSFSKTLKTINSTKTLHYLEVHDYQTLLSATLSNQETCYEGLYTFMSSWSIKNGLFDLIFNGTKLYSTSLALFMKGWGHQAHRAHRGRGLQQQESPRHYYLPFKKSNRKTSYETSSRRKLLQTMMGGVLVSQMVEVNPNGSGDFITINEAVLSAPNNTANNNSNGYFMIYVVAGVYEEYVTIPSNKRYLMMIGDGINQTVITGNHSVVDGWTTFNSGTFAVTGQGFIAINITIRNTAGAIKHQAVALRNGADLSAFYSCSFEGYQDTLYTHSLRQFYRDCDIYGTVDFIFGNAAVVLQNCNIYPKLPLQGQYNAITAQARTDVNQNTGTSIHNCNIRASDDLQSSNGTTKTYLGRPWKEYSRTVFMESFMDGLIYPLGWKEWSGDFALSTLYYAEYNNTGQGSNTSSRVTWPGYHVLNTSNDAVNFTVSNFVLGDIWLPSTGVPFNSDLLYE